MTEVYIKFGFTFLQESKHLLSSNLTKIIANLTPICQRYTDVMAHKYYLQHLLFNKTNNVTAAVIMNLTSVIMDLQFMGYSLEAAQVCMCVLCIHILIHVMTCGYCRWKIPA